MTPPIDIPPAPGEIVRVRSPRSLVESVEPPRAGTGDQSLVRLSCLEDDAEGEPLEVLCEKEIDDRRMNEADWSKLARGEFDPPRWFAAYYRTLRWNSGNSSRNSTPCIAREISPGRGVPPPPTSATPDAV